MDEQYESRDFKSEMEAYKLENDSLKRECDKITLDYEMKIADLKREIEVKSSGYENLRNDFETLKGRLDKCLKERNDLTKCYDDVSVEKLNLSKKCDELEAKQNSILELIARREKELTNSKDEVKQLQSKLDEYKNIEIETKLQQKDLEYRQKDFKQTEQSITRQNKKLEEEIKKLETELSVARRSLVEEEIRNNNTMHGIHLEADKKRNEIKQLKSVIDKLNEKVAYLEKANDEKGESLRAAVESQTNVDNLLRKELHVQTQMVEIYREERDDCQHTIKNLTRALTEMQDHLKEIFGQNESLKTEFEAKLSEQNHQVVDLKKVLSEKEKEIKDANDLIEKFRIKGLSEDDLKSMNAATAAAIGALKKGYSMTQIYSEYMQVVNERDELKIDRDRLNEYLNSMYEELEQKAPAIKRQQQDYAHTQLSMSLLSKKFDDTISELSVCRRDLDEYKAKCEELTKKLKRESQTTVDLSQQVCYLLREIESFRGTVIRSADVAGKDGNESMLENRRRYLSQQSCNVHRSNSSLSITSSEQHTGGKYLTSKDVITTHLVTFKNVCELQQQNIHLIEQLRDLSDEMEKVEGQINEQSMQEIAKKLDKSFKEGEILKDKLKKIPELEKIVEKQRYIIKALSVDKSEISRIVLTMDDSEDMPQSHVVPSKVLDESTSNQSCLLESQENIITLQQKIDCLQLEIKSLHIEKDKLKDKHMEVVDELQKEFINAKTTNVSLMSKCASSQTQIDSLEQNLINKQLEYNDLQNEYSETNQKFIQIKEELKTAKNELRLAEFRCKETEQKFNDLEREIRNVARLEQQIHSEKAEKYDILRGMNNLSAQLESLQAIVSKSGVETLSTAEIELKAQVNQLTSELNQERSKFQVTTDLQQTRTNELLDKIAELESRTQSVSNTIASTTETQKSSENEKIDDLEMQIEDLTVVNESLKIQLQSYTDLLSTSEAKLLSNAELIEQMESQFQDKVDEEKRKNEELTDNLNKVTRELSEIIIANESVKKKLETEANRLSTKLEEKLNEIDGLKEKIEALQMTSARLKADVVHQRQLTNEAMSNYHLELQFHTEESNALQVAREELQKYEQQDKDLHQKLQEAERAVEHLRTELDSKSSVWIEEKKILEEEMKDLKAQRDKLGNQLVELNELVVNLKKLVDPSLKTEVDHAIIQQESDWTEVIQYLRQEKENSENARSQLEVELYETKIQQATQDAQLAQLKRVIEEERKLHVLETETNKKHLEVMRSLEQMQQLRESNQMLRQGTERLEKDLADRTAELTALRGDVEPMRAELRTKEKDLEAVRKDLTVLETERNLWRQKNDKLMDKLKQVDDFTAICAEKEQLQVRLEDADDRCGQLEDTIRTLTASSEELEALVLAKGAEVDSLQSSNNELSGQLQQKEGLIGNLRTIGHKYKNETITLQQQLTDMTERHSQLERDLESLREELSQQQHDGNRSRGLFKPPTTGNGDTNDLTTKLSQTLKCDNTLNAVVQSVQTTVGGDVNEQKLRYQLMESRLNQIMEENERLRRRCDETSKSSSSLTNSLQDDDGPRKEGGGISEVVQTTPVARVAATVVQKPTTAAAVPMPSTSQSPAVGMSLGRQTAEIRPLLPAALTETVVVVEPSPVLIAPAFSTTYPAFGGLQQQPSCSNAAAGSIQLQNARSLKRPMEDESTASVSIETFEDSSVVETKRARLMVPMQPTVTVQPEIESIDSESDDVVNISLGIEDEPLEFSEIGCEETEVENVGVEVEEDSFEIGADEEGMNSIDGNDDAEEDEDYDEDNLEEEVDDEEEEEEEDEDDNDDEDDEEPVVINLSSSSDEDKHLDNDDELNSVDDVKPEPEDVTADDNVDDPVDDEGESSSSFKPITWDSHQTAPSSVTGTQQQEQMLQLRPTIRRNIPIPGRNSAIRSKPHGFRSFVKK